MNDLCPPVVPVTSIWNSAKELNCIPPVSVKVIFELSDFSELLSLFPLSILTSILPLFEHFDNLQSSPKLRINNHLDIDIF